MTKPDFLDRLTPGADIDLRGERVEPGLLEEVLKRCDRRLGTVRFEGAIFPIADFTGVQFAGDAYFERVKFSEAVFGDAWFDRSAIFTAAVFHGDVGFSGAIVHERAVFRQASFETLTNFELTQTGELDLSEAAFARSVEMDLVVGRLRCDETRFDQGVTIRMWGGPVSAERTVFGAPSSIAGLMQPPQVDVDSVPGLLSLQGTDVSNLVLVDMDLRRCQFAEVHRLDQLRLEGRCVFDLPPKRNTRRRLLAEEAAWRGWRTDVSGDVRPEQLAGLYRSLRKAFEDSKNEAGAGDFYYGEMEMRRHSVDTGRAERFVLWCYWVLSGYGQRAIRAVTALLVLVVTVAVLLAVWGQPPAEAAQIAIGAVVLRDPGAKLTEAGQWTVMVARFLGPVLLALAVLAVRARVKR